MTDFIKFLNIIIVHTEKKIGKIYRKSSTSFDELTI